jgi:hypothetical protein
VLLERTPQEPELYYFIEHTNPLNWPIFKELVTTQKIVNIDEDCRADDTYPNHVWLKTSFINH